MMGPAATSEGGAADAVDPISTPWRGRLRAGRVLHDAVFAIAMTLLVVEVGVPERIAGEADDPAALLDAFGDKGPLLFAFFLGCYVIGSYWAAHHRFMSWLGAVDRGFVVLTVVYLSFVALLPSPPACWASSGRTRSRWSPSR